MKRKKFIIVAIAWAIVILVLKHMGLLTLDLDTIKGFLEDNERYAAIMFVSLWSLRMLLLIPGVFCMFLGGVCFGTLKGFVLSIIGITISEIIIYLLAGLLENSDIKRKIEDKYGNLKPIVEKYNYKFLILGIVCPVTPTDVACFLSASAGINFIKYTIIVMIVNMPMTFLYSYLGVSFNKSIYGILLIIATIILIGVLSYKMWNEIKKESYS